ncbi:MAG: hypothetical protein IJ551_11900 [Prevotella sp.]|nr:hypothetical protein [Prevotella sp.]
MEKKLYQAPQAETLLVETGCGILSGSTETSPNTTATVTEWEFDDQSLGFAEGELGDDEP